MNNICLKCKHNKNQFYRFLKRRRVCKWGGYYNEVIDTDKGQKCNDFKERT